MVGAEMRLSPPTRVGDSYSTAPVAELLKSLSKCLSQLSTFLLHYPKSGPPSLHLSLWDLLILTPRVLCGEAEKGIFGITMATGILMRIWRERIQ